MSIGSSLLFKAPLWSTKIKFFEKCAKKRFMSEVIFMEGEKMASRYNITLPNGVKFTLYYSQEQDKADLISKQILEPWTGYCLRNWLSEHPDAPYSPEKKVKWLLDRCGTLLLRDVPEDSRDTLTSYKESMIRLREINASDCPPSVSSLLEGSEITQQSLCDTENQSLNTFLD